jgi:hypothetical protein
MKVNNTDTLPIEVHLEESGFAKAGPEQADGVVEESLNGMQEGRPTELSTARVALGAAGGPER